jgi:hypothetical protein
MSTKERLKSRIQNGNCKGLTNMERCVISANYTTAGNWFQKSCKLKSKEIEKWVNN